MSDFPFYDALALAFLLSAWIAYGRFSLHWAKDHERLQNAFNSEIAAWSAVLPHRDLRMVDTNVIANLERTATFLASSSLLIIAGLLTVAGAGNDVTQFLTYFTATGGLAEHTRELKILVLVGIYAYVFFTYTWCMRQYGLASILIANAPLPELAGTDVAKAHSDKFARVVGRAIYTFNVGLRGYYFSIACLAWFVNPWACMIATSWIVLVLYRREFKSETLQALS